MSDQNLIFIRDQRHKRMADQLILVHVEVAAAGIVDEGQGPIGQMTAHQLGLVLDNGAVTALASFQIVSALPQRNLRVQPHDRAPGLSGDGLQGVAAGQWDFIAS